MFVTISCSKGRKIWIFDNVIMICAVLLITRLIFLWLYLKIVILCTVYCIIHFACNLIISYCLGFTFQTKLKVSNKSSPSQLSSHKFRIFETDQFKPPQWNLILKWTSLDFKNFGGMGCSLLSLLVICEMSSALWYCIYMTMISSTLTCWSVTFTKLNFTRDPDSDRKSINSCIFQRNHLHNILDTFSI